MALLNQGAHDVAAQGACLLRHTAKGLPLEILRHLGLGQARFQCVEGFGQAHDVWAFAGHHMQGLTGPVQVVHDRPWLLVRAVGSRSADSELA